jgi:carbon storage regulator CsrA
MLVLSRKEKESIVVEIGDQAFELTVSSIRGNCVSLAFDAPQEIRVLRKELKQKPAREKKVG